MPCWLIQRHIRITQIWNTLWRKINKRKKSALLINIASKQLTSFLLLMYTTAEHLQYINNTCENGIFSLQQIFVPQYHGKFLPILMTHDFWCSYKYESHFNQDN